MFTAQRNCETEGNRNGQQSVKYRESFVGDRLRYCENEGIMMVIWLAVLSR